MNFKAFALAALATTTIGIGFAPQPASASGVCYEATTAQSMNSDVAGGATLGEAWQWAIEDGTATDTKRCWTRVQGFTRTVKSVHPYLWNAITNR